MYYSTEVLKYCIVEHQAFHLTDYAKQWKIGAKMGKEMNDKADSGQLLSTGFVHDHSLSIPQDQM